MSVIGVRTHSFAGSLYKWSSTLTRSIGADRVIEARVSGTLLNVQVQLRELLLPYIPSSAHFVYRYLLYSRVGGEFPVPIMTHAPTLVTSSTVRKMVAGPGGYTRPLGGVTNVSDLRSADIVASMKTRRALEWDA